MKMLRIFIYLFITLLVILVPIYGTARIILPNWLKNYVSSSLPPGSELLIGEMESTPNMGVLYKNLVFKNNNQSIQLSLQDLILEPNLSISKPANFKINSGIIKTNKSEFSIKNLSGNILISSYKDKDVSILGNVKELKEVDKSIFNNIEFLINGIIDSQKKINVAAEYIDLKFLSPNGIVRLKLNDVNVVGNILEQLDAKINAKNLTVDLSEIGRGNPNRILTGENILLYLELIEKENWQMPINFKADNIKAKAGTIGSELDIRGLGIWKNASIRCDINKMLSGNEKCGKLIDVVKIGLKFKDTDNNGNFEFSADGYCVTPNAGCPQLIESSIKTKNTAEIISKTMLTGFLDPLLGGVLLGALLSSPNNNGDSFDHKANIKVIGNKILLNGKPII